MKFRGSTNFYFDVGVASFDAEQAESRSRDGHCWDDHVADVRWLHLPERLAAPWWWFLWCAPELLDRGFVTGVA